MPRQVDPLFMLAWIMATHQDAKYYNPQEAIRLAKTVCQDTYYNDPRLLDALAAAYAAAGRFADAVATAENALNLAKSAGQNKRTEQIQARLSLYRAGKPFVEHALQASSQ